VIAQKNLGRDAKAADLTVAGVNTLLVAVEFALMSR